MPLTDEKRSQLDSIVSQMESGGEKPEDIQFVVDDFKAKHGVQAEAPQQPGVGELRRREGQGEIASKPVESTADRLGRYMSHISPDAGGIAFSNPQNEGELAAQQEAAKKMLPYAAAVAAPESIPARLAVTGAKTLAGYIARQALVGGVSGAAYNATKQATEGRADPGELAKETAIGAGTGAVIGPALGKAANAIGGGIASAAAPEAAGSRIMSGLRGAAGGILKPLVEPAESAGRRAAREAIEKLYGVEVPTTLGDAVGNMLGGSKYVQELKKPVTGSVSPDEMDAARQAVIYAATKIAPPGASPSEIATATRAMLKSRLAPIDANANAAIEKFSTEIANHLEQSGAATAARGARLVGPGTDRHTAGETIKEVAGNGLDRRDAAVNAAYDEFRAHPFVKVKSVPSSTGKFAKDLESQALKTTETTEKGILGPNGEKLTTDTEAPIPATLGAIQKEIGQIKEFSGTPQSLENLLRYRTLVRNSVNDPARMVGIPERDKWKLVSALTQDINNAVDSLPTSGLKNKFAAANKLYAETADSYKDPFVQSLSRDVGVAKGTSPAQAYSQLTGSDAQANFDRLKQITGEDYPKVVDSVRRGLAQEIHETAYNPVSGIYDLGNVVKRLDEFKANAPREFQAMFPNYDPIVSLAKRQASIRAAGKLSPEDALHSMSANPRELADLLEPSSHPEVTRVAQNAMQANALRDRALSNQLYADVMGGNLTAIERDPQMLVNKIIGGDFKIGPGLKSSGGTGGYSPDIVGEMMSAVQRQDPKLAGHIQESFMESLLNDARKSTKVGGKVIDPDELMTLLTKNRRGDIAEKILGPEKLRDLTRAAQLLRETGPTKGESILSLLGSDGVNAEEVAKTPRVANTAFLRAIMAVPRVRLALAGRILNNNSLRKIAATPFSKLTEPQTKALAEAVSDVP
jgi:hypothetical protein